ncbi:MAG: dTDP-4-dehydrorhamnose 3,5-epimerase [Kofleriaceae bacterium]
MNRLPTPLPGVLMFELDAFHDERGVFLETYRRARYDDLPELVQDNLSSSSTGTLRGLHYQRRNPQGKLVTVTRGEIYDVAVELRTGRWFGTHLSATNRRQLWIPPGFAHGFQALSDADVLYKCSAYYDREDERAIRWDDPTLAITWPLIDRPKLSPRDAAAPSWHEAER